MSLGVFTHYIVYWDGLSCVTMQFELDDQFHLRTFLLQAYFYSEKHTE